MYLSIYLIIHMSMCIYIYIYIHICTCGQNMYVLCVCVYVYIYIYIYILQWADYIIAIFFVVEYHLARMLFAGQELKHVCL